jgi:hypothetical protein
MEPSAAEKAKARRYLLILRVCTVIGVVLPVVLFFLLR